MVPDQEYSDFNDFIIKNKVNYTNTDKTYWKQLIRGILTSKFINKDVILKFDNYETYTTRQLDKALIYWRYHIRLQNYHEYKLSNPYFVYKDTKLAVWLEKEIAKMYDEVDDPCIDNVRFAKLRSKRQIKRYKRLADGGCCGFFDKKIEHPDYGKFIIGCNYGH